MSSHTSPTPSQHEDRLTPQYQAPPPPPRKVASTGGGRAWSEEEENYLIETRQHKMPYKHIAAHLNKTELACRLHYHQLSFGTKRRQGRRRTSSVSSARSSASSNNSETAAAATTLAQQRPLPQLSPPASPENHARSGRSQSPNEHPVPILPKPICSQYGSNSQNNALRLITADVERYEERNRIDKQRLARIYDAHRAHFWAAIARDYGENVAPQVLEEVWWRGYAASFPPTPPNRSPHSPSLKLPNTLAPAPSLVEIPPTATFQPVNSAPTPSRSTSNTPSVPSRSTFAIASLLTEDKEVGHPIQLPPVIAH